MVDYFSNIFKSNGITDASAVVGVVQPMVTESMSRGFVQEFQVAEVVKALKQMHPKKSPSRIGILPLFYQHYWSLVGNCVAQTILDFLNHGIIPSKFNETHVVLNPKIKNPMQINQYRPINLSNVVSRITIKVLAPRPYYPFTGFAPRRHSLPIFISYMCRGFISSSQENSG